MNRQYETAELGELGRSTVQLEARRDGPFGTIVSDEALGFVALLHRAFNPRRCELLDLRMTRQGAIDQGHRPGFLAETAHIRNGNWQVAPIPADLQDRRVEITGPTSRKMVINALNSGARVFMADFEDSNCPTWDNMIDGQINMRDAISGTIDFTDPKSGKHYALAENPATLIVRPRGWHLEEAHVMVDGQPVSASIFDFALFFFHNHEAAKKRGTGTYFYLPKMESHLEARLWNDVFVAAQSCLGVEIGTIKATVLIETILAAFEMDEILYELRDHAAGLNCGRWDYIFSMIKRFRNHSEFQMPDRAQVTMTSPNMRAYCLLAIQTCHKRGAHAIGGMAAQIPIKDDEQANAQALDKVMADKQREAEDGHDGSWVAHPGLVPIALNAFNARMKSANQLDRKREDVDVSAEDLLQVPQGTITDAGVLNNIQVGLRYLTAWVAGNGCVPIFNLMEDAATAEISRSQLWQWAKFNAVTAEGTMISRDRLRAMIEAETAALKAGSNAAHHALIDEASEIFTAMSLSDAFEEFLTLPAYQRLLAKGW